jgi:hypothetical protein
MSTDEETYSKTVAEASNKNVENVTKAAQSGGEAQANILS